MSLRGDIFAFAGLVKSAWVTLVVRVLSIHFLWKYSWEISQPVAFY